jgi:hypothetical protein
METKPKRPISVWIAQIVMILGSLLFLLPLVFLLFLPGAAGIGSIFGLVFLVTIYIGISFLFGLAFWGMARRRSYGRWIAVGMLSFFVATALLGTITRPSGPLPYAEYENATQAIAGFVTQVIMFVLLIWLTVALAIGKRAAAFFSGEAVEDSNVPPPDHYL